jgi:hypothetical protein
MHSQIYSVANHSSPLSLKNDSNCFHLPPFNIAFPEHLLNSEDSTNTEAGDESPLQFPRVLSPMTSSSSCASPSPVPQQSSNISSLKSSTLNWSHQFINFSNSFPNLIVKKRPRSKYEEVKRLYPCKHPNCNKAYGALNHLNAHIVSKGHGPKRSPMEFQELRKAIKLRII